MSKFSANHSTPSPSSNELDFGVIHTGAAIREDDEMGESLVFDESGRQRLGPQYKRAKSTARGDFCRAMLSAYDLDEKTGTGVLFPSGMAAIGAVLSSLARTSSSNAIAIVHGDELYCDVKRTVDYVRGSDPRVESFAIDVRDRARLLDLFQRRGPTIGIFHFEACTNPSGQVMDLSVLPELRRLAPRCAFVCDNTWLTSVLFNPLQYGADIVVESCTKYISGGACIGGVAVGRNGAMDPVEEWSRVFGQFVPDTVAGLFLKRVGSMPDRVRRASANAAVVARAMETDDRLRKYIDRVHYPGLESHPTHEVAERYLKEGYPGCIWFHLPKGRKSVQKRLPNLCVEFKTSFGGPKSRYDPWPVGGRAEKYDLGLVEAAGGGKKSIAGTWIRLSLGYEEEVDHVIGQLCEDVASIMK